MNFNLRKDKYDKEIYKYLSEDKILELEKLKISKQLEGRELETYKTTKCITIGIVLLFTFCCVLLPLGFKINNTIKHIYMIKYNYVLIDDNIVKNEDTNIALKEAYFDQFIYRLTCEDVITKENVEKIINSLKEIK
jgi:hypothetical protein